MTASVTAYPDRPRLLVDGDVPGVDGLPGVTFDGAAGGWCVPASRPAAALFVHADVDLDAAARRLLDSGSTPHPSRAVSDVDRGMFVVTFPYDDVMVGQIRAVPGATWNGRSKRWRIPHSSAGRLRPFLHDWAFTVPDDVAAAIDNA